MQHPTFNAQRSRSGGKAARRQSAVATKRVSRERNVPFYQTNPPFFFGFLVQYARREEFAWKCYEEFRWVRFPKRTHREGFLAGFDCREGRRTPHPNPLPQGERRWNYRSPTTLARRRGPYPPILPNEASCNLGKWHCIYLWWSLLCRLQKNDNWLRFWRMWACGEDANVGGSV